MAITMRPQMPLEAEEIDSRSTAARRGEIGMVSEGILPHGPHGAHGAHSMEHHQGEAGQ